MRYVDYRSLLSELRAVERRYLEVVSCQEDADSRHKAAQSAARLKVYDDLLRWSKPQERFPAAQRYERFLRATIDRLVEENGCVRDPHFSHLEL